MAKRERNKRAARKARQQERERVAEAQAKAGAGAQGTSSKSPSKKSERTGMGVVTGYFGDVRSEMRQVTWPSRTELRNYSLAVIASLIFFGVLIWLVDTGFVAALVQFTSLRG